MTNETWIAIGGGAFISHLTVFLIGKSGVVRRFFDNRLSKIERQQKKEESDVEATKKENQELHTLVDELTKKVSHLETELATTNLKLTIVLAYIKKVAPDEDTFLESLKAKS